MSSNSPISEELEQDFSNAAASDESWWLSLLPMILIFFIFYFLVLRPQEKKRHEQEIMVNSVKKGNNIITTSGIYGKVVKIHDSDATVEIEIADNFELAELFYDIHIISNYTLITLISLHIFAVIVHKVVFKENLIKRIL